MQQIISAWKQTYQEHLSIFICFVPFCIFFPPCKTLHWLCIQKAKWKLKNKKQKNTCMTRRIVCRYLNPPPPSSPAQGLGWPYTHRFLLFNPSGWMTEKISMFFHSHQTMWKKESPLPAIIFMKPQHPRLLEYQNSDCIWTVTVQPTILYRSGSFNYAIKVCRVDRATHRRHFGWFSRTWQSFDPCMASFRLRLTPLGLGLVYADQH